MEENYKNGYFGCKKIQSIGWMIFFFCFLKGHEKHIQARSHWQWTSDYDMNQRPQKNMILTIKKINKKQMREMGVITWVEIFNTKG